tara:strand:+ start:88 stop:378 length:291 start_codon:yes stop_codon:yes gene_type:complete
MKKLFRIVALLEGVSYILLLFIATPIKYLKGDEQWVKILGMPHGLLFAAYVLIALLIKDKENWKKIDFFIILFCSILPFGTFYVEKKYLKTNYPAA